jgi:3-dehydroquinate dehydratase-1
MICVSIAEHGLEACLKAVEGLEMVEIRLDRTRLTVQETRRLFSTRVKLIATCRPGSLSEHERKRFLLEAIGAGAAYVDLELEAEESFRNEIVKNARARGCRVIISYHDFEKTPAREVLTAIVDRCFEAGADLAKIACAVRSGREAARLLGLLDSEREIVIAGMGPLGRITRLAAPLLGTPFTYASLGEGQCTAPGQMAFKELQKLLEAVGGPECRT